MQISSNSNATPEKIGRSTTFMYFILSLVLVYLVYIILIVISQIQVVGIPSTFLDIFKLFIKTMVQYVWVTFFMLISLLTTPILLFTIPIFTLTVLIYSGNLAGRLIILKKKNIYLVGILTMFSIYIIVILGSTFVYVLYDLIKTKFECSLYILIKPFKFFFLPVLISGIINACILGPFLGKNIYTLGWKAGLVGSN